MTCMYAWELPANSCSQTKFHIRRTLGGAQALLTQQTSISKRHLEAQQAWGLIICDSKVSVLSTDHAARLHWLYETMYGIE